MLTYYIMSNSNLLLSLVERIVNTMDKVMNAYISTILCIYMIVVAAGDSDTTEHLTSLQGSVMGDPHVMIKDIFDINMCYELREVSGEYVNIFHFMNSDIPELIVTGKLVNCGGFTTCFKEITIEHYGQTIKFTFDNITLDGEVRLWSDTDMWTDMQEITYQNVGNSSTVAKQLSLMIGADITVVKYQHGITYLGIIFNELGDYNGLEGITGVVGSFINKTFTYDELSSTLTFGDQPHQTIHVREDLRFNPAKRRFELCYVYDQPEDAYQYFDISLSS